MKLKSIFIFTILILTVSLHPAQADLSPLSRQAETIKTEQNGIYSSGPNLIDKELLSFLRSRGITEISSFAQWLADNTTYVKDSPKDTWASPVETLNKRGGDCEDFAFLSSRVAALLGYEPHILILSNHTNSHAVCAFQMDGIFFIFNNNRLQKTRARSLEELALILTHQTDYTTCKQMPTESQPWQKKARIPPKGVLIAG